MVEFLIKKTIKNYKNIDDIKVRESYTILSAILGIITNFILILIKLIIGIFTNSVSILGNAIDSMTDFGSNIVTIVGSKIAKKPADKDHPFGHQRVEYVTGLIVSMFLIFVGGSLFIESIQKIVNKDIVKYTDELFISTMICLLVSIFIKVIQAFIYRKFFKLTGSLTSKANFVDSLTDTISSFIIIFGVVLIYLLDKFNVLYNFSIDGTLGIFESVLIVISGFKLVKNEINFLIGAPISHTFVNDVENYIKSYDKVLGVHDTMCHMYGPYKCFMTIHVELPSDSNFEEIHDMCDEIEHNVLQKYNINLTIHMDPVDNKDPISLKYKEEVSKALLKLSQDLSFHDFRVIKKNKITTLIFDIVVPYNFNFANSEITKFLYENLNINERFLLNINYDQNFIE